MRRPDCRCTWAACLVTSTRVSTAVVNAMPRLATPGAYDPQSSMRGTEGVCGGPPDCGTSGCWTQVGGGAFANAFAHKSAEADARSGPAGSGLRALGLGLGHALAGSPAAGTRLPPVVTPPMVRPSEWPSMLGLGLRTAGSVLGASGSAAAGSKLSPASDAVSHCCPAGACATRGPRVGPGASYAAEVTDPEMEPPGGVNAKCWEGGGGQTASTTGGVWKSGTAPAAACCT